MQLLVTAGEGFHPLQGRESYMATQFEGKFGFLNIEISNGNLILN